MARSRRPAPLAPPGLDRPVLQPAHSRYSPAPCADTAQSLGILRHSAAAGFPGRAGVHLPHYRAPGPHSADTAPRDAIALAAEAAGEAEGTAIRDALRGIGAAPGEHVRPGVEGIARALSLIRDGDEVDYAGASVSMDWDEFGDLRRGYIGIWRFTADAAIEDVDVIAYER